MRVRFTIFFATGIDNTKFDLYKEKYIDIPIINIKNGNTKSVGVSPLHAACRSGA